MSDNNRVTAPDMLGAGQQLHGPKERKLLYNCSEALKREEDGDYESARQALSEWWPFDSALPCADGLGPLASAELLLRAGVLTGYLVSAKQPQGAQVQAKELINESIRLFEQAQQGVKVAEARAELAWCFWREGDFMRARLLLKYVIAAMGGVADGFRAKAVALLHASIVELESGHHAEAHKLLIDSAPFFNACDNPALKGKFHNNLGVVYKELNHKTGETYFLELALHEHRVASFHLKPMKLKRLFAHSQNNLGFVYFLLKDFEEADKCLRLARKIFTELADAGHVAQVNDTQAQLHLAKGECEEAVRFASDAVHVLEAGERHAVLAEALTTKGVALARVKRFTESRKALDRAIEVAEASGAWEMGGLAMLSALEELQDGLDFVEARKLYERARFMLTGTQHLGTLKRLDKAAGWIMAATHAFDTSVLKPTDRGAGSAASETPSLREVDLRLSSNHSTVLITGKSAKARRVLARYAHELSGRSGPLVIINCGGVLEDNFSFQELLSRNMRDAVNGTLFIDEVEELSGVDQRRLLRLVKSGVIEYGRAKPQRERIDVRVITGTSCDLSTRVKGGLFLPDLFEELSGLGGPLSTPSPEVLERLYVLSGCIFKEEVESCYPVGRKKPAAAALVLRSYAAGAAGVLVRQHARMSAQGGYVHAEGAAITPVLVGAANNRGRITLDEGVRQVEMSMIREALEDAKGHSKAAAELLGMKRQTLENMLKTKYPELQRTRTRAVRRSCPSRTDARGEEKA